jgi:hypothetical protein
MNTDMDIEETKSLDLYQIRRNLITLRSRYSSNAKVTAHINRLLGKISHLQEPKSSAHRARLERLIAETTRKVFELGEEASNKTSPVDPQI